MAEKKLPLKEMSIEALFNGEKVVYVIPIYQRNYAWESDEIHTLVQDIHDAYIKGPADPYFIGTLVTFYKGDNVYEVIDGQQRLTTIRLLLDALETRYSNTLTYRARKKSDKTLRNITDQVFDQKAVHDVDEKDSGIESGYKHARNAIGELGTKEELSGFRAFFLNQVHIVRYVVPKDIDLNHYFEIMNSRGEQLEKHEIIKAKLMQALESDEERKVFNYIWECSSEMSVYTQQNLRGIDREKVFGRTLCEFRTESFEELLAMYRESDKAEIALSKPITIAEILRGKGDGDRDRKEAIEQKDSFQPIIDFPNFLLIVLKIIRMQEGSFSPMEFILDDKELINEFDKAGMTAEKVRTFAFMLLKARFLLDNYMVHHSKEEDTLDSNPWKLQVWYKDDEKGNKKNSGQLKNLVAREDEESKKLQDRLVHLLSMFEVSFTARQRKNYLFYCLLYLLEQGTEDVSAYAEFADRLADQYFHSVYLDAGKLSAINTPVPGSFDEKLLEGRRLRETDENVDVRSAFNAIYGDGTEASKGVPLFIFNYLDYKLWRLYNRDIRGKDYKEYDSRRKEFFSKLGCSDFGLRIFDQFYFSRTRRSLEHYYPQANVGSENGTPTEAQINCFGNYAMIGSAANSSGSNWSPKTKLDHYLDPSGKINMVSVASLKFMIMMQTCKDNETWGYEDIRGHQEKMLALISNNMRSEVKLSNGNNKN